MLLMTAATGAWAQTGMINGLFSVSPTKRVYFSKGNLQYDGTNWKFAENQWEVLGANGTGATGTATNYPMDFFTWGNIDSPTYNGTTYYTENADLSGITDWGSRMGSGWYTLSKDEWLYLFGMESNKTDKSGHARYRKYFRATVNGLPGIVVLPDDLSGISDIPAESSRGTASTFSGKTYTTDAWSAMESAGCVFLPTAGFRKTDASVSHVGWSGFYWESTTYDAGKAYTMGFDNTFVDPAGNFDRTFGFAVRLVIDQYYLTLADGVKDADKWTVKVGEGQAQALPIGGLTGDGSETVTLQYNGRLKVKGVKATSDEKQAAKTPATVTTAPTGAAIVGVGKNTALVSGGAADGGTLWYAVTTTNTKPASTDGFSATVPTAETITASGKVYVWYYVKGDDTHSDSEIAGPVSVTVTPALSLTNPVVGQVIGSDGKNYAAASVPSGVTKVAMIAYVSGSNGLAIALADEGLLNWATAKSTCEAKTPAFTGGTWKLPSMGEWNQMFSANGGDEESYTGLNTAINNAGGTTLQSGFYWSSSEYSPGVGAHLVHLDDGDVDWSKLNEALSRKVRACLAF